MYFQKQPGCTVGDDKILKVELRDEQARTAISLKPGDYVGLRNMRLKLTDLKKEVIGRIAGNERLIHKLNPNDTGNEDFIALLQYVHELFALTLLKRFIGARRNGTTCCKPKRPSWRMQKQRNPSLSRHRRRPRNLERMTTLLHERNRTKPS